MNYSQGNTAIHNRFAWPVAFAIERAYNEFPQTFGHLRHYTWRSALNYWYVQCPQLSEGDSYKAIAAAINKHLTLRGPRAT